MFVPGFNCDSFAQMGLSTCLTEPSVGTLNPNHQRCRLASRFCADTPLAQAVMHGTRGIVFQSSAEAFLLSFVRRLCLSELQPSWALLRYESLRGLKYRACGEPKVNLLAEGQGAFCARCVMRATAPNWQTDATLIEVDFRARQTRNNSRPTTIRTRPEWLPLAERD
ncbi:unnamed protein product [Effrenium voratum]|uniref:Uncharacterized protein n=1 Tax=Effrenium voratum TaxID=2562239 RepID=A0AA36ID20_9DINO|nr:unnamed protein product [Effrenium voratum]